MYQIYIIRVLTFLSVVLAGTVTEIEVVKVYVQKVNSVPSISSTQDPSFSRIMLDLHNEKRQFHRSQPLHWNASLYEFATNYASSYDCSGQLVHSGGPYGENLAAGYSASGAVNAWYDEGKTYQYGTESVYDHFTAVVWNNTNSIGCSYKECNNAWGTYIICSYYPPGNIVGSSNRNVFPPL